jgi:polar amino acid transport system substrate-binding protein
MRWRSKDLPGRLVPLLLAGLLGVTACGAAGGSSASNDYNTIQAGVLNVAIEPYMPYTALQGGDLVGLDSDITKEIAKRLNLKIATGVTDFKGMLAGVQS